MSKYESTRKNKERGKKERREGKGERKEERRNKKIPWKASLWDSLLQCQAHSAKVTDSELQDTITS